MIAVRADLSAGLQPVRHQGRRSSCLAFASSTAHEHRVGIDEHLCVEYLFFHAVERTPGKNPSAGITLDAVASALADEGQPVETAWPYSPVAVIPWTPPAIATPIHKRRMLVSTLAFDDIIKVLDGGHPIVLGVIITDAFFRPDALGRIPDVISDIARGGHAVLAVGHGIHPDGTEMLLIRNSWGASWGLKGHGWLSRAYLARQLRQTATLA